MYKVCHMTSAHNQGDGRIFERECVSLCKAGFKVYLVIEGNSNVNEGVEIIGCGEKPSDRVKRILFFSKKIFKTAKRIKADIYHIHDPELLVYALRLKRTGAKVIFDAHEDYKQQILIKKYIPFFLRKIISYIYDKYEGYILKNIDGLIRPCERSDPREKAHDLMCSYYCIVGNEPILPEIELKLLDDRKYDLCYVGAITKERGIINIVNAIAKSGASCVLAGPFETKKLEKDVLSMVESGKLIYKGIVDHNDVWEIYNNCKIGLAVLRNIGQYKNGNNLATKVYEYLASGMPVILNDSEYNSKFIRENEVGFCVDPDNVEELSNRILYLKNNLDIAKKMGENGRRLVFSVFNWSIEEKKLIAMYKSLFNI